MKITNEFVAKAYEMAGFKDIAKDIRGAGGIQALAKITVGVIKKVAENNQVFKEEVHNATSKTDKN